MPPLVHDLSLQSQPEQFTLLTALAKKLVKKYTAQNLLRINQ